MRRETLWYLIAAAWLVDSIFALYRHNGRPAILTLIFACCFFGVGLYMRHKQPRR
jgi:hypothetical protein